MTYLQQRYIHHLQAQKRAIERKDLQIALVHNHFIREMKLAALLCLFAAWSGSSMPHYELQIIKDSPYI